MNPVRNIPRRSRYGDRCKGRLRSALSGCLVALTLIYSPAYTQEYLAEDKEEEAKKWTFEKENQKVSDIPVVDLPEVLSQNLDGQFEQILKLEEELDAYDDRLGESYSAYAAMLAEAGRLDDARDMYAKVLHLTRINNGVYSLEQRPVLRAMFNVHDKAGELEEMEAAIGQIVWLEHKNPEVKDLYSYDLVLRMGAAFIDLYYTRPRLNETSLSRVQKAIKYLNYAVRNYDFDLDQRQRPKRFKS